MEPELTDDNLKNLLLKLHDSYGNATKHFIQFLTMNNLTISYKGVNAYIQYLKNPGSNYTPRTYNLYLASLKNRMNFLMKLTPSYFGEQEVSRIQHLLASLKYEKIDPPRQDPEVLSVPEIKKLVAKAPVWLGLVIRFLVTTGVLISELIKIRYTDIKQDKTYTRISVPGRKKREIRIDTPFMYAIAKHFNGNTFLFEDKAGNPFRREMMSMNIKRLGRKILAKEISARTLRRTFVDIIVRKTGKIKGVSDYLGHKSVKALADLYVHETLDPGDLNIFKV